MARIGVEFKWQDAGASRPQLSKVWSEIEDALKAFVFTDDENDKIKEYDPSLPAATQLKRLSATRGIVAAAIRKRIADHKDILDNKPSTTTNTFGLRDGLVQHIQKYVLDPINAQYLEKAWLTTASEFDLKSIQVVMKGQYETAGSEHPAVVAPHEAENTPKQLLVLPVSESFNLKSVEEIKDFKIQNLGSIAKLSKSKVYEELVKSINYKVSYRKVEVTIDMILLKKSR